MIWIGCFLIGLSLLLRYLGTRTLIHLCSEHWDDLFEPLLGHQRTSNAPPLFPDLSPADFDDLIIANPKILRALPRDVMRLGMLRLGLRNWGKASFWIGLGLVVLGMVR